MTILFLCGSLEPGKDGVGDYTRRLAGELIRQGHQASIISLNDKHCDTQIKYTQESDGNSIEVLRLPSIVLSKERFYQASLFIENQNPEWLSLQYVPYSFHNKGLPIGLSNSLTNIGKGRKWHIMFHELWVGMDSESSVKLKTIGLIQKQLIKNINRQLKPKTIHTQTTLYNTQLHSLGINSKLLPLFGNIPFWKQCEQKNPLDKTVTFVIFGSIHWGAPINDFINELLLFSQANAFDIKFMLIGRCGKEQNNWISVLKTKNIAFSILGEQPSTEISKVLSEATWGISTTPMLLAEKSGTVAAMLEHELSVIIVARPWIVNGFSEDFSNNNILEYLSGNLSQILDNKTQNKKYNTLAETTNTLINSLLTTN